MVSLVEILKGAGKELYKHQLDFVSDVLWLPRPRLLLADDVGLGKTIQALLLVKALMELGRVNHVLVIVPRAVLGQWANELEKFEIPYHLVESPEFPLGHRAYLITMDKAKTPSYLDALSRIEWDLVVIDEAHKIRIDTQRQNLSHLCKKAAGCLLLTATPHTGYEDDYRFLTSLVGGLVIRREKRDVEEYEGRRIFPRLNYWIVQVRASREEAQALWAVLQKLRDAKVEPIVRVVVEKRAMSSPSSFFKTLGRVVGGSCDAADLEEGELDACIGNIAGWRELVELAGKFASASDRKLEALRQLLNSRLRGRKVLVFTEYATTAEYLFQSIAGGCKLVDAGEGFAKADCGDLGVMYVTSKARERLDVNVEAAALASSFNTALFISTDIMSEGVNLQMYDVVVNYEVVWSPTKHVQRVGRIWRFGQRAEAVLVVDMVLKAGGERDEYAMYLDLLEKLYNISLKALPPQSYGQFEIYELSEQLQKILEIGSSAYLKEVDILGALGNEEKLRDLRRRIEAILKAKEGARWKPRALVEKGLRAKLGYPFDRGPESGGGYYVAEVEYHSAGFPVYRERVLVRLRSPLSRSREVAEGVFREGAVEWDYVAVETGEVREDERDEALRKIQLEVWIELKRYLDLLRNYIPALGDVEYKVTRIKRARVEGLEGAAVGGFEEIVEREVRRSKNIERTEQTAVSCVKKWLGENGYSIKYDYYSGPRPFDLVVVKDGVTYVVEIKGKWAGSRDDYISFTANEIDFASRFPSRYIICVAYVDGDRCLDLSCTPFAQFQREWVLETVRGIEYKYNARRRSSS